MDQNTNLPTTTNETAVARPEDVIDTADASAQQEVMKFVKTETRSDKIKLLNALENADEMINNHIGEVIEIVGVYAETHFSNKQQKPVCRVLIMGADGKSYATGSFVFMNSLKRIIDVFGSPLDEAIKIQINERAMEKGNALTASVVE